VSPGCPCQSTLSDVDVDTQACRHTDRKSEEETERKRWRGEGDRSEGEGSSERGKGGERDEVAEVDRERRGQGRRE